MSLSHTTLPYGPYDGTVKLEPMIISNFISEYTYCNNYPNVVSQECPENKWTYSCNYGDICISDTNSQNHMNTQQFVYSRIPPLTLPTNTPIDYNIAWDISK